MSLAPLRQAKQRGIEFFDKLAHWSMYLAPKATELTKLTPETFMRGVGVVEIIASDPKDVGILASASKLLADAGISIRQALVDDPELSPEPKLTLIGDSSVPGNIIPEMLKIKGVARISVY